MKIPKIKTITQLRSSLYETFKEVSHGDPQIVTHKQGEGVVLISQTKLNNMIQEREVLSAIATGVAQLDAGKGIPHKEAVIRLRKMKERWK